LKEYLVKYQDPQQADSIMKIQKELDETKIVLHKTIESVLQRGEKIDDLVAKSDGLSAQSKMFYSKLHTPYPRDKCADKHQSASEEAELVLYSDVDTFRACGARVLLSYDCNPLWLSGCAYQSDEFLSKKYKHLQEMIANKCPIAYAG
jgi:hypothetical protein